jgi:hypothetical protein
LYSLNFKSYFFEIENFLKPVIKYLSLKTKLDISHGKKRCWVDVAEIKGERESIKEATTEKLSEGSAWWPLDYQLVKDSRRFQINLLRISTEPVTENIVEGRSYCKMWLVWARPFWK